MAPTLGYWNIRGLAQPIRLMLSYCGEEFEDKKYNYGPAPDFSRSEWLKEKHELGLDFPNLPYYIDGDVKLTQSIVIMRYLARKLSIAPCTEEEKQKSDIIEQQMVDFRNGLTRIAYHPDFEKLKEEYLKTLPAQLEAFSKFLGDRNWFASPNKVTYVDFIAYESLDVHRIFAPEIFNKYPVLKDYLERVETLPSLEKYMESPNYMKWPLNGDMAKFGSRSSEKPKE